MIKNTATAGFEYELPDGTTETGSQDSNVVVTTNLTTDFTKVKSSDCTYLKAGQTATQTVTLTNTTHYEISNITFTDTLSGVASYVPGSVTVNGTSQPTYDLTTGFTIPNIAAGDNAIITYEIIADEDLSAGTIANKATIEYTVDDETAGSTTYNEDTNTVELDAISADLDVVKSANRDTASSGDIIEYTIVITNNDIIEKTNLTFLDTVPTGTTFNAGSVVVDGTNQPTYDPNTGFALSDLDSGDSTTVKFSVTVD